MLSRLCLSLNQNAEPCTELKILCLLNFTSIYGIVLYWGAQASWRLPAPLWESLWSTRHLTHTVTCTYVLCWPYFIAHLTSDVRNFYHHVGSSINSSATKRVISMLIQLSFFLALWYVCIHCYYFFFVYPLCGVWLN